MSEPRETGSPHEELPSPAEQLPLRSPKTFEQSPTTFARSRERAQRHVFDMLLGFLRLHFGSEFLGASAKLFTICGQYGLFVALAIAIIRALLLVQKGQYLFPLLWILATVLTIPVFQYIGMRFLFVMERWEQHSRAQLSSSVVPDGIALLSLAASIMVLLLGTVDALTTGSVELIFWGVATFTWGIYTALQSLNLEGMGVSVNPDLGPAEEVLGLLQFGLKTLVRLAPVVFGGLVLLANVELLVELSFSDSVATGPAEAQLHDTRLLALANLPNTRHALAAQTPFVYCSGFYLLLLAAAWPAVAYGVYLLGQIAVYILAGILSWGGGHAPWINSELPKRDLSDG